MLIEWLKYLSEPCPKYLRDMGLLHELIAIESRYNRCQKNWASHLDASRNFICKNISAAKGKVLVLGSGYLLDCPINQLTHDFAEVILVDLVHMKSVRKHYKDRANIRFIELDLTGSLKHIYDSFEHNRANMHGSKELIEQFLLDMPSILPDAFLDDGIDLVISLNLTSQLPIMVLEYIEKECRKLIKDDYELDTFFSERISTFAQNLIKNHILYLVNFAQAGADVLLLTDFERKVLSEEGQILERLNSLEGLDLIALLKSKNMSFANKENWTWDLAPYGELEASYAMELDVVAGKITPLY